LSVSMAVQPLLERATTITMGWADFPSKGMWKHWGSFQAIYFVQEKGTCILSNTLWKKIWNLKNKLQFKHWSILTASKHPHKSFSRCCCSLLIQVDVLKHLDDSFKESNTLRTSQLVMILSLCSGSGFLASARGSASEFWETVEHELLTMGIQKLEGIFSIIHTNLCAWFKVLLLAVEDDCWMTYDDNHGTIVIIDTTYTVVTP
jgi:hypothetical protein